MRIAHPGGVPVVELRVYGDPKPAGSKVSGVAYRREGEGRVPVTRNGKIVTFTKDSSGDAGKVWRNAVADIGVRALDGADLLSGPLYVEMTFLLRRPKGHYGSGKNAARLKDSAPLYPAVKPDCTKLARSAEDALTGCLWRDDSLIICGPYEKVYAEPDEAVGVEVRVWVLPGTVGEDALAVPLLEQEAIWTEFPVDGGPGELFDAPVGVYLSDGPGLAKGEG